MSNRYWIENMIRQVIRTNDPEPLIAHLKNTNTPNILLENRKVRVVVLAMLQNEFPRSRGRGRKAPSVRDEKIYWDMRTLIAEGWGVEAAAEQVERWLEAEKRALGNDAPKHFAIQAERIMRIYNHKNKMRRGVKVVEK